MKRVAIGIVAAVGLVAGASRPGLAQVPEAGDTSYGYLGASVMRSTFDLGGCAAGYPCGESDTGLKLFAGAWNDRTYGLETSYVNFGKVTRNGGESKAQGVNASFLAGLPLGDRAILFAKVGATFSFTSVRAAAPGVATGNDRGLGFSLGAGAQLDLDRQWALRADWDLYRMGFAGRSESVKVWSIGGVVKF